MSSDYDKVLEELERIGWPCRLVELPELYMKVCRELEALSGASACKHPVECVEAIAALEYPGGTISWCKRCGAWHDDDACEWHLPGIEDG